MPEDVPKDIIDKDLVCAYEAEEGGKARKLGWDDLKQPPRNTAAYRWVHLHHEAEAEHSWLRDESGLDHVVRAALLAPETRPRCTPHGGGALLNLRGVNLNPGSEVEDMVSIRIWADEKRIVSVRLRRLMAVKDMRADMDGARAPATTGDFLCLLASRLTERMEPEIIEVSDGVDGLEDDMLTDGGRASRQLLADLRRRAVMLRRFIAPQRDALNRLGGGEFSFLSEVNRIHLREAADRVTRMVEELDAVRERAALLHDQLTERRAEEMNRHMLVLSIAAAIFLPLTFLTGLLGMNVGGLPWGESPYGFVLVLSMCGLLSVVMAIFFRRLGWM